jgi:hypothetical protein
VDQIRGRLKNGGDEATPPVESHGYTFFVKALGEFANEIKWMMARNHDWIHKKRTFPG